LDPLTPDEIERLYREYETSITTRIRRGLFAREKDRFDDLIARVKDLSFEEARRHVLMLADTVVAEQRPGLRIGVSSAPWGTLRMWRPRLVRRAPPIPGWCRIVAEFRYLDQAREHALRLKGERPQRILGYDFNPKTGLWAVLECDRLPPGIETDKDGLFILP
jgi:hypothetical protein